MKRAIVEESVILASNDTKSRPSSEIEASNIDEMGEFEDPFEDEMEEESIVDEDSDMESGKTRLGLVFLYQCPKRIWI